MGQATLYRHFADKGEICHALIKEDLAAFQERVGALIGDARAVPSPLARLEILIVEKNRLTKSHLPLFAAIDEAAAAAPSKPFRGPFHMWLHEQIISLLAQAVAQGEVAPLDAAFAADAILAAVAPHLYRYQRQDLGYSSERIMAAMCHLFIDGLRRSVLA